MRLGNDDNQPSRARITKSGDGKKWFESGKSSRAAWVLEVRSEDVGAGSIRLGDIVLTGSVTGDLMISTHEEGA